MRIAAGLRRVPLDAVAVFGLALVVRLVMVVDSPGGLSGIFGYDAGVYYAASDAILHGRLPYRDFVLLHPTGLPLFLTPFAALGTLVGDHIGFEVAVLACTVMSAVSAALVVLVGRLLGVSRAGCLAGGAFYAIWFGTLNVDYAPRLEGLGSFLFLLAAYLMLRGGAWWPGVLLGATVTVKIWWILPVLLVVGWLLRSDRPRAGRVALGAAGAVAVLAGPFFVAAPNAMWRMVVLSQAIRANSSTLLGHLRRLDVLSSTAYAFPNAGRQSADVVAVLSLILLAAVAVAAWRSRPARLFVVVAVAQLLLLIGEPSYLSYYSGYVAGPLALMVAAAVGTTGRAAFRAAGAAALAAAAVITAIALVRFGNWGISRFPDAGRGRAAAAPERCVLADSPMALIELDALSRGLSDGCPNWVDVSGQSHVLDIRVGHETNRFTNRQWQAVIGHYLLSGDAVIVIRHETGLAPSTARSIARLRPLAHLGRFTLRATR